MFEKLFRNITDAEKNAAVSSVIGHSTPRQGFFLMLMLSISMASFGVLLNNIVILVGSMLIAPLLYPILSLALGVILADQKLIRNSFYTILKSVGFALAAAFVIGFLFSTHETGTLASLTNVGAPSSLMYAIVAAIAGFAAAFAMIKPYLNDTLPGVAISVSLVPPLATAGVALATFDWAAFSSSLLLFLTNIIGIVFSAMIVFSLFHLAVKKTVAEEALAAGEKIIKKEQAPVKE